MPNKQPVNLTTIEPLLIDTPTAAGLCGISPRSWATLVASGQAPPCVRLGGRVLYRLEVIRRWAAHDCPSIEAFLQILEDERKKRCD
jgi:predicted DNA-binding transcriptional regulator AlpA